MLGPLLFNIFLNDMFYVEMSAEIVNYADDNNLVDENDDLDILTSSLAILAILLLGLTSTGLRPTLVSFRVLS